MELEKSNVKMVFYDSIKEIPAGRLLAFQLQLTQHNSMGSTFEEVDSGNERLDAFLSAGRVEDAIGERQNQRFAFWYMFNNINTQNLVLANLVKEINGTPVVIRKDEDALKVCRLIEETDISVAEVEEIIEKIKKKLNSELRLYLPELFNENHDIDVTSDVIRKAIMQIEHTLGRKDYTKELADVQNRILNTIRPLCFDSEDPGNYQVEAEKSFEELCALLTSKGLQKPQEIPALQFYLNIRLLTKKKGPQKEELYDQFEK